MTPVRVRAYPIGLAPSQLPFSLGFWDVGDVPAWLEWLAAILGIAGFVMAIQPFVQWLAGKPKLALRFEATVYPDDPRQDRAGLKTLEAEIFNLPLKQRWLRPLGIERRTAEPVRVTFAIYRHKTGETIVPTAPQTIKVDTDRISYKAQLLASYDPATVLLVAAETNGPTVALAPSGQPGLDATELEPGLYDCVVTIHCGDLRLSDMHAFHVGQGSAELHWV